MATTPKLCQLRVCLEMCRNRIAFNVKSQNQSFQLLLRA